MRAIVAIVIFAAAASALPSVPAACLVHAASVCEGDPVFVGDCTGDTVDARALESGADGCDVVDVNVGGREQDTRDVVDVNVAGEEDGDSGDQIDVSVVARERGDSADGVDVTIGGAEETDTGDDVWIEILPQVGCAVDVGLSGVRFCAPNAVAARMPD